MCIYEYFEIRDSWFEKTITIHYCINTNTLGPRLSGLIDPEQFRIDKIPNKPNFTEFSGTYEKNAWNTVTQHLHYFSVVLRFRKEGGLKSW